MPSATPSTSANANSPKSLFKSTFSILSGSDTLISMPSTTSKTELPVAPFFVLGVCLAIGLILAGYFISGAVMESRRGERTVTVRGLAEREVPADLAIWPLTFRAADNDLAKLQQTIAANRNLIREFLVGHGFTPTEIIYRPPTIVDLEAQTFNQGTGERPFRYLATSTLVLCSNEVEKVKAAMEASSRLVEQGIVLGGEEYGGARPEFQFTALNSIKPEMLKEANLNARQAANRFADDSATMVGAIRRANQGLFEIRDRDANTPEIKIVRVVTTVEYFLREK